MKNFNIMGVHQFLGEGGHKKTMYRGNVLKKMARTICRGLGKKEGGWWF